MHRSYAVPIFILVLTLSLSGQQPMQQRTAAQEKAIAERTIDPTWLYRDASTVTEKPSDITTATCHYKPMFGQGDSQTSIVVGVARFGTVVLDPGGSCASIEYPGEDQIYTVLDGSGSTTYADETVPLKKEDFLYIPATIPHALSNATQSPMTVFVMGFKTKGYAPAPLPAHALKANIEDVPTGFVGGHPDSTLYRLLLGDSSQTRDRIDVGNAITSFFLMEIAPGGTNFPHHHQREEEIYIVLDGHGDMVAGDGGDGMAGRHSAKPGDAYFFRLNATVGYYSAPNVKSRILCVRSWYPGMVQKHAEH
jgi:mannose-6-phosphate isomerase-like protein (cupin superfamily)